MREFAFDRQSTNQPRLVISNLGEAVVFVLWRADIFPHRKLYPLTYVLCLCVSLFHNMQGPRQLASQSKQQQQQAGPPSSSTNRGRQQQQQQQSGRTNKLAASPRWNPNHKFIHLKDGKPIVPFEVVLRGKTGEERRRLMNEIAVDVQEWRRWRSAQAAERAEQRRRKEEQQQQKRFEGRRGGGSSSSGGSGSNSKPATPEEAWKQRLAQKRQAAAAAKKGGGGARGGAAGAWDKRGSGGSKQQGSKRLFK